MKTTAERWTTVGFVLATSLIVGLSIFNHVSTREYMELTTQRMQARRLVVALKDLFATVREAESSQRGYLLTGEEHYLAPYINARSLLPTRLKAVESLLPDHQLIAREIEPLKPLIHEKFAELERTVEERRTSGVEAALAIVRSDEGDRVMSRIRTLITQVEEDVVKLLEDRAARAGEREQRAVAILIAGDICSIGIISAIYVVMLRLIRSRRRAFSDLRCVNETLEQRVEDRTTELRHLNAQLEQRVAERTAELQAKNKELETFSYSVSHDLKAPLRGIDGYSRLLLEDYSDKLDEDGRSFLKNIRTGATQMQQLIEDLLAYSKLERRALFTSRVPLRSLVETILDERRHDLTEVRLETRLGDESVDADRDGLALALRNLIDNAAKFSRHQATPSIEVCSRTEGGRCILSVRDNGTGFDMKYHDLIFQIFHRLHRAEEYGGTGVGLAIVRKAMERMGGRVWAESRPGDGAVFYLDLPLNNGNNGGEQRSFQP